MSARPLEGIRVLDLTRLLPGAYATLLLADLGADVIKIEDPVGGDSMRSLSFSPGAPDYFELLNRNKRSITLNLRSADAVPILDALIPTADVIIDSFRPSAARRLHVDPASLRAKHPRLISVSITGFGREGPLAERPAHDINYQAMAGLLRPPALPGPLVGDIGSAMQAAIAVLAALIDRQKTGAGSAIDISILGAAREWSLFPTTADLAGPCYQIYEAADGRWLALGALEPKFWRTFCEGLARPDLVSFQYARGDEARRVVEEIRTLMRARPSSEWMTLFAGRDTCLTRIEIPGRTDGDGAAPALGADTDAVLGEAGLDVDHRKSLRDAGVI
jgi:crotonobetainyl-CoA:carnitine CoA-transferase CaiB-like acyl-CoA transferase